MTSLDANRLHSTTQAPAATPDASTLAVDQAVLVGRICENCGARGLQLIPARRGAHHRAALATCPRCHCEEEV
jgi:hypothetical protein